MKNYNMQTSNCNCNMADGMMHMREKDAYRCESFPVGMGYVPWQEFKDIYDLERSLNAGTIFAELDKPFMGRRAFKR